MTASARYLLCYAAGYAFLVHAQYLRRIWTRSAPAPDEFHAVEPVDLRECLGNRTQEDAIALGLDMDGGHILLVDQIGRFSDVGEEEFLGLPAVFEFAREMFDAACKRAIEGAYPLRLRLGG